MSYAVISQVMDQLPSSIEVGDVKQYFIDIADDVVKDKLMDFDNNVDEVERQDIGVDNPNWIQLNHYPILDIEYIKDDINADDPVTVASTDYIRDDAAGIITLKALSTTIGSFTKGSKTVEIKYDYGYASVPADVARYASALVAKTILVINEQDAVGSKVMERMGDYQYKLDIMMNLNARFHYIAALEMAMIRKYKQVV